LQTAIGWQPYFESCIIVDMNITLTPDSERYLRDQLAAGKFPSADAVVSEALCRMRDHEQKLEALRREIVLGIEQADQGLAVEFDEASLDRIRVKGRRAMPVRLP
jgi:putative addiction module CopG family antidote